MLAQIIVRHTFWFVNTVTVNGRLTLSGQQPHSWGDRQVGPLSPWGWAGTGDQPFPPAPAGPPPLGRRLLLWGTTVVMVSLLTQRDTPVHHRGRRCSASGLCHLIETVLMRLLFVPLPMMTTGLLAAFKADMASVIAPW